MTNDQKKKPDDSLESLFENSKGALAQVLPKHLPVERVIRIALAARSRNPLLMKCTSASILQAVMTAAQLGLEPGGPLAHSYLVPYRNNKLGADVYECQLIPGYRGLIELARRAGMVKNVQARVVHAKDTFAYSYGLTPTLVHEPSREADPGPLTHVYAIVYPSEGEPVFEVMSRADIDRIRGRSRAAQAGPWVTDYEEMGKKTVIKRLLKTQPMSQELASAIDHENQVHGAIDIESEEVHEQIEEPKRASETAREEEREPTNEELDLQIAREESRGK